MSALTESEPFRAAMDLLDISRMCGGQNSDIAPFVVDFMTREGLFNDKGQLSGAFVRVGRGREPKPYKPRHDPAGWTPRLSEKEWLPLTGEIYRRDGFVCAYCEDTDGPFQIDHIVPVTRGGSNDKDNLCVACKPCNSSKGDRLLSEWRVNHRTGKVYPNPRYTAWKRTALDWMWEQKPAGGWERFPGAFNVHIALPLKLRIDPDNIWKPILDFLQKPAGIIANDKHSQGASQARSADIAKGMCRVFVYEAQGPHPCPPLPLEVAA